MDNVNQYSRNFKQKSFSSRNIFVKHGDLPLIITAGHGGQDHPANIPNRKKDGSVLLADMYTSDISAGIEKGIYDYYKRSPHLILNLISRRKVDVNRQIEDGAESEAGVAIWKEYHDSIQCAIDTLFKKYKYGLLIDIHGHTHPHEMIELGYLLELTDLKSNSKRLDQLLLEKSSIRSLVRREGHRTRPHQILLESIGDTISAHGKINVVPSSNPEAKVELYYSGGYTTKRYNEIDGIDVIQIELPKRYRYRPEDRQYIIKMLVEAIIGILDRYYLTRSKL